MAKSEDTGSQRRLLYCKNCNKKFYTYKLPRKVECPTCHEIVSKETNDENIEDGTLRTAGAAGGGKSGCLASVLVFLLVLACAAAAYVFRDRLADLLSSRGSAENTPVAKETPTETPVQTQGTTDTPVDTGAAD